MRYSLLKSGDPNSEMDSTFFKKKKSEKRKRNKN